MIFLGERHLPENVKGRLWRQPLIVFLSGRNDQSCHIEGTWTDDKLFCAFGIVAVGTMLATWENDGEELIMATPADNVHHRLCLVFLDGQCLVETQEELFIAVLRMAADKQGRAGVLVDDGDVFIVVEADDLCQVTAQSLPGELEGQHTTCACLEMGVIGS